MVEHRLDGTPATPDNRGDDVVLEGGAALCRVREARLYNVSRTRGGRHSLELRFRSPGARTYTLMFG